MNYKKKSIDMDESKIKYDGSERLLIKVRCTEAASIMEDWATCGWGVDLRVRKAKTLGYAVFELTDPVFAARIISMHKDHEVVIKEK